MSDHKQIPGKLVWFELVTTEARKAQAFYGEVLGWKTVPYPPEAPSYDMIYVGDAMIGGYAAPASDGLRSRWIAYVSVADVDQAAATAAALGGTVVEPPTDLPEVGRTARIADPQGAEIALLRRLDGDPPDVEAPLGHFFWLELHTSDPAGALGFYQQVLGFGHRDLDMGPAGTYHVIAAGGVDRGGVTGHLGGAPPHWLPYVHVEDPDATAARARDHRGTVAVPPMDIPGAGRFAVIQDPTGAALAVMKPIPMDRPR